MTPEFANQTRAERVLALERLAGLGTFVGGSIKRTESVGDAIFDRVAKRK